ncbi:BppU family phage baseplate upper protein [Eggerthella guodeyinii]|uniref:DUF2479 domain-containing protein n=1 Tax=Eggerthella guodeyinii TaxID=2690837 RepID=A0A6N7RMJ4_9ACTN|nr:BppU family phage baseplate upper protein [Eggerthella guodeyinii]MRX82262.1 DUF2479 domain-containing protein [Eggerthella guodeyinii]
MNTQTLELDISKRGGGQCVIIGQGDKSGTTIEAHVYDNGATVALAGYTVQLVARLPDRAHYARLNATASGSVITCVVDESKLASVSGYTDEAYFTLAKGGATYSTERFALDIKRSGLDGQTPAKSWDSAVDALIAGGTAAVASANDATKKATSAAKSANDAAATMDEARASAERATEGAREAAERSNSAAGNADISAEQARGAAGRANSAADEAEEFLNGFIVDYSNLSDECKALIAQSAGTGASLISDEQGIGIIDDLAPLIASGRDAGCLTNEQGTGIIDDLFT